MSTTKKLVAAYGQQNTAPGYTASGVGINYFTTEYTNSNMTLITSKDQIATKCLGDVEHYKYIAQYLWTNQPQFDLNGSTAFGNAGSPEYDYMQVKGQVVYNLRNQSNEPVHIVAYHCKVRKDIKWTQPNTAQTPAMDQDDLYSIYNVLGFGFAETGLIRNVQTGNSAILNEANWTPFQSRAFTEVFKITKVQKIIMDPGQQSYVKLTKPWHKVQPSKLFQDVNGAISSDWGDDAAMLNRFTWKGGAKFVLFGIKSQIAGIDAQTSFQKNITYTTPTVIMQSNFTYFGRYYPQVSRGHTLMLVPSGMATGTASIMRDGDEAKGAETDAS